MFRYGFELEGFYKDAAGQVAIPPSGWPTDVFPGLVELRTSGGDTLEGAYGALLAAHLKKPFHVMLVDFDKFEHSFSAEQKRLMRKQGWHKEAVDVQNLYGKKPRNLRGKTLASLQINVSDVVREGYTDDKGVYHYTTYNQLDVARIVKGLDLAFKPMIASAGRQAGEYCIKGNRLEYRSTPNNVFTTDLKWAGDFLDKIRKAVENV